jgi:DNA-binding transcriptional LysR family regulator
MTPFDDLVLLRAFLRIVESGSISAAARTSKTPQPTLSRYLRTLEERAGARLLQRDTHHMRLTAAGQRLAESARAILGLAEDATQRLHGDHAELRGHLRVSATIDLGQTAVTRVLARFLQKNPELSAELAYSNRPVQMIEEGYDVGVVAGGITDERVVARPVGSIARYLVASPHLLRGRRAPKDPGDVEAWPWAALAGRQFGAEDRTTLIAAKRAARTFAIAPVLTAEGVTSLRQAVLAGLAIAVLPDWLVREDVAAGRLVRVLPQWSAPDLPLHVIYFAERNLPLRVRAFIEAAAATMTAEMDAG